MEVVYRRCCELDVHKNSITACVLVLSEQGEREVRKKEFPTYWTGLQQLRDLTRYRVNLVGEYSRIHNRSPRFWKTAI